MEAIVCNNADGLLLHGSRSGTSSPGSTKNAYGEAVALLEHAARVCEQEAASERETRQPEAGHATNTGEEMALPASLARQDSNRMLQPSEEAYGDDQLFPCDICGRTFAAKALERHAKICEKVSSTKRRVFDGAKKRLDDLGVTTITPTKKVVVPKPPDEFQSCPTCSRSFNYKAYDRHVEWCLEKSRRMQTSPKKDLVALAKLQARVAYQPARTRSDSTSEHSTKSLGRSAGISFLKTAEHTRETADTHFIRATTGRGSIKRGPAPTKSSVLRQQKTSESALSRSQTPVVSRVTAPITPTPKKRVPSPSPWPHETLVKPSVVRPYRSSYGQRREPEGIEHERSGGCPSLPGGHYDHSREYDPFRSAARQMQELLFGVPADLRPSTHSAFDKYVPSPNVPTTADINTKLSGSSNRPKFCHNCGSPYAVPDVRFCCECGVKRLYC